MHSQEYIKEEYSKLTGKYETLGTTLKMNLEALLKKEDIGFLSVTYRVKEIDSLLGKVERKEYSDVFNEVEDFCGARIICYYTTDLKKIDEIIEKNFVVESKNYKENELGDDKFGYLSNHYIVKLKEEWCNIPTSACCKDLKAEIQVRTILMHAWADVSHKLNYKTETDSPKKLRRKLNQLSALFEMADGHFVELKEMKEKYIEDNKHKISKNIKNTQIEENVDSLQAIMDLFFPKRLKSQEHTELLFQEITKMNYKLEEIVEKINGIDMKQLEEMEKDLAQRNNQYKLPMWAQVGIIRMIMRLCYEDYMNKGPLPDHIEELIGKWREKILNQ